MLSGNRLLLATGVACLSWLCACNSSQHTKSVRTDKAAGSISARPQLRGGDPHAWLTQYGDNADSGYCDSALLLPLVKKQVWTKDYSSAEFSTTAPQTIVHYDGVLCVSAITPQLMLLDPRDGRELDNENVHQGEENDSQRPMIVSPFLHPAGLLLVRDESAKAYCLDIIGADLTKPPLWINDTSIGGEDMSCVAQDGYAILGGQGQTSCVSIEDGAELWSYPSLLPYPGKVVSRDGILVWFSRFGKVLAIKLDTGVLLWSLSLVDQISRVIVDDDNACIYLSRYDERLECRNLADGALRWEYTWRDTLSEDKRTQLLALTQAKYRTTLDRVRLFAESLNCTPGGLLVALVNGDAFLLDKRGNLVWRKATGFPVVTALTFQNAVLLLQEYSSVNETRQLGKYLPFMLTAPDWETYKKASDERKRLVQFDRFLVLGLEDGRELDSYELQRRVSTGPIPAYNMLTIGQEGDGEVRPSISALPWVDWKGSN